MKFAEKIEEAGATGYILLWLLGIPIPILLVIFLLRGCTYTTIYRIPAKERIYRKSLTVRESSFGMIRLRGFPRFFHGRDNFWKRHDLRRFGAAILTEGGFVRQLPVSDLG